MFTPLRRDRSRLHMTLELICGEAYNSKLIDTPFQILECHPRVFDEVFWILPLDYGLQHLAYIETISGQLHGIVIVNHILLLWQSTRIHRWTWSESTDPDQDQDSTNRSENLLCGGGSDCFVLQDIDPLVEERYSGLARAGCHCHLLGGRRTSKTEVVESRGRSRQRYGTIPCDLWSRGARIGGGASAT